HSSWNGKDWSALEKYGPEINSKYWEPSACLAPDGNTLYFVSDRPGGFGGRDIYRCKKLPNKKWSLPLNMGSRINTIYDEESPFMHPNGTDLYYSSEGHNSMGGFDIMFSKMMDEEGHFSDPLPMPYPVNTTDDDVFFVVTPDSKRAYYASAHEDKNAFGDKDIYMISLLDAKDGEDSPLALLKGQIVTTSGQQLPVGVEIFVTDKASGELIGTYRPQVRTGSFVAILKPGQNYVISYQKDGKEFKLEDLPVSDKSAYQEIQREIMLDVVTLNDGGTNTTDKGQKILLDVIVLRAAGKHAAVANAVVEIIEKNIKTDSTLTNDLGKADSIALFSGRTYELRARQGNYKSVPVTISTNGIKTSKISKTIYLQEELANESNELEQAEFRHYFTYNQKKIDSNPKHTKFLSDLEAKVRAGEKIKVMIHSSASKVPTSQKGGNKLLAQSRAESLKKDIVECLVSKGLSVNSITFDISSNVAGPEYKGDFLINKKNFEKFQYVEASIK
ncbi:MAG TPA: hypothetical protein VNX68_16490, partial [Nitrosopumilaceae archaeon]|nr:hypothetical protein [Nitrosopumilaceae archaeon]